MLQNISMNLVIGNSSYNRCQLAGDGVARMECPSGARWQHPFNNMGVREIRCCV